ncbi:MAG: hypothetical protein K6L81_10030 [Agarilytica sp.]
MKRITYLFLTFLFLQGCAGTRYSYKNQLDIENDLPVLRLKTGETTEILAAGDGFPGRWGYFPWVISSSADVASIDCIKSRSTVPFREPGIVFGGLVCTLIAHKPGHTTLYLGNKLHLTTENYSDKIDVIIIE